jgi:hypothetical protein
MVIAPVFPATKSVFKSITIVPVMAVPSLETMMCAIAVAEVALGKS